LRRGKPTAPRKPPKPSYCGVAVGWAGAVYKKSADGKRGFAKPEEVTMAKRVFSILVLAVVIAVGTFAQSNGASVDIVPLIRSELLVEDKTGFGLGITYERLLGGGFSIGGRLEFVTVDKTTHFGFDVHGRWYPLGASLEKLFLDAGLGYGRLSYDGETLVSGLTLALKAGWKLPVSAKIFVEPTMGYALAKGTQGFGPSGWGIGLSAGMLF
jgi:hypothetical protein